MGIEIRQAMDNGRKFKQKRIKDTQIKLAIISNNEPDWEYMEKFIRNLPCGELL